MNRPAPASRLAVGLAALLITAAPTWARPPAGDAAFAATTLNLSAAGEARAVPDMATISLGVVATAPTAVEAQRASARRMTAVAATLARAGLSGRDVQTSGLSLAAQYVYAQNQPPKLSGYRASNTLTVVVRDLTKLGPAVDAATGAGADAVDGISFGLSDPQGAEDAARRDAVRKLGARSALYANATGQQLGRLVTLTETGGYNPPQPHPVMMMRAMSAEAKATPVEAGELTVKVGVSATYELVK